VNGLPAARHRDEVVAELSLSWRKALFDAGGTTLDEELRLSADLLAIACAAALTDRDQAQDAADRASRILLETRLPTPQAVRAAVCALSGPEGGPDVLGPLLARYTTEVQRQLLEHQDALHRAVQGARDHAERARRASEARFRALFTEAAVGMAIGDLTGGIVDANPAMQALLGYPLSELRRTTLTDLARDSDSDPLRADYEALMRGDLDSFRAEVCFTRRDMRVLWTTLTAFLIRAEDGEPVFPVTVVEDITARHDLQARVLHQATHDALTGLPNRSLFLERLEQVVNQARPGTRVALCFLDLDGFKYLNDSRGHLVGDHVLQEVARRLAGGARRSGSLLARLAGDEFAVLITSEPGQVHPVELARELQATLAAPIAVEGQLPVAVRASVGVVDVRAGEAAASDLLRAAELSLHAAKDDGRGTIVTHDPSRTARQLTRFEIAMSLTGLVDRDELALSYQPLVRLTDRGLHSVEALLRWRHPRLGNLSPELFVSIAEESSAIIPIGRWALDTACADLAENPDWPAVNVNVSIRQLYSPTFVKDVRNALDGSSLSPDRLRIEVTERVLMGTDDEVPLGTLRSLSDLGVRIVLDDFGTGYSNLAALRRFPLHELKLAGTFVQAATADDADPVDVQFVATLVGLAHTLGLLVTAEGVETERQAQLVRAVGCDVGQGWFYGVDAERR